MNILFAVMVHFKTYDYDDSMVSKHLSRTKDILSENRACEYIITQTFLLLEDDELLTV